MTTHEIGTVEAEQQPVEERPRRADWRTFTAKYGIYAILVAVVIAATIVYHGFLEWGNIELLLTQNAPLGIVAAGMTLVIICGGFDLSVGAIYAGSGTVAAMIAIHGSVVLGFVCGIVGGVAVGLVNALVVTKFRVNPFIATFGSGSAISGVVLLMSHNQPYTVDKTAFGWLGQETIASIPIPLCLLVIVFAVSWIALNKSLYGRKILSVGGNSEASRLAGIRTDLITGSTYVASGLLSAIAGVVSASQLGVGQGNVNENLALSAIAAVVIGGTSLLGGEGSIVRTAVGLLILAVLDNIFFSLALSQNWQSITQGLIVIGAVGADGLLRRRRR